MPLSRRKLCIERKQKTLNHRHLISRTFGSITSSAKSLLAPFPSHILSARMRVDLSVGSCDALTRPFLPATIISVIDSWCAVAVPEGDQALHVPSSSFPAESFEAPVTAGQSMTRRARDGTGRLFREGRRIVPVLVLLAVIIAGAGFPASGDKSQPPPNFLAEAKANFKDWDLNGDGTLIVPGNHQARAQGLVPRHLGGRPGCDPSRSAQAGLVQGGVLS